MMDVKMKKTTAHNKGNDDDWKEVILTKIRKLELFIILVIVVSLAVHFNSPYLKKSDLNEIKDAIRSIHEIQEISTSTIANMAKMIQDIQKDAEVTRSTPEFSIVKSDSMNNVYKSLQHKSKSVSHGLQLSNEQFHSSTGPGKDKSNMIYETSVTARRADSMPKRTGEKTTETTAEENDELRLIESHHERKIFRKERKPLPLQQQSNSRKLQSGGMNQCNGVMFRVEIFLDDWASQTSWSLLNVDNDQMVMQMGYSDADQGTIASHEICTNPGNYKISVFDDEWGILCSQNNYDCYNIYIDGERVIQGSWFSGEVHHSVSVSSGCFMKTRFRLELQLDHLSHQTSWLLEETEKQFVVAAKNYTERDYYYQEIFELCLEPGKYHFSLYDDVSGIRCNSDECLAIYLDNNQIASTQWFSSQIHLKFETSSRCHIGAEFLLEIDEPYTSSDLKWNLKDRKTQLSKDLNLLLSNNDSGTKQYYVCVETGSYDFNLIYPENMGEECRSNNACVRIKVHGETRFESHDFIIEPTLSFFLSREGNAESLKHHNCDIFPLLSPINEFNNFEYDERISRTLEILGSLTSKELMSKHNTPQYRAICWILYDDTVSLELEDNHLIERFALAILLHSFSLEDELRMAINTCDYDSVFCNEDGLIVEIEWPYWGIEGTIPFELSHLRNLEVINFAFNKIRGTIPPQMGRLTHLRHFFLQNNELSGKIPDNFGLMNNLESISFQFNFLSSSVPSEFGELAQLDFLDLTKNKLTGSIPPDLFHCTNLSYLSIRMNEVTGAIHTSIGNLKNLKYLKLDNNLLGGTVPSELGLLSSIERVSLFSNFLSGTLPPELSQLTEIETLLLSNNEFSGTLPEIPYGDFKNLWAMEIMGNKFSGRIPDTLWDIHFVQHYDTQKTFGLFFEDNDLLGTVPKDHCDKVGLIVSNRDSEALHIPSIYMDNSPWFLNEPKIECSCCSKGHCYIWSIRHPAIHGTIRPQCPKSNAHFLESHIFFGGYDKIKNETYFATAGSIGSVNHPLSVRNDLCLSPTGCYVIFKDKGVVSIETDSYHLGYSSLAGSLIEGDVCDSVQICGTFIPPDHPRRVGLNHLTQLVVPDLNLLTNPFSTEQQAVCWTMTEDNEFENVDVCDGTLLQRYVMAHMFIYYGLMGESLKSLRTCSWPGVTCDSTNKFVEHLDLSNRNLKGNLYPGLHFLTRLKELRLHGNNLSGFIRSANFLPLRDLEVFDVGGNGFVGDLPKQILKMPHIKVIDLSFNNFGGELPDEMGSASSLEYFNVGKNLLKGHIPVNIIRCDKLKFLDLSRNYFKGTIPPMIGNLKDLESIDFSENRLSGSIPGDMLSPPNITNLALQSNLITGSIPTEIGFLKNAEKIRLDHNRIKGQIPSEVRNLISIKNLQVHVNSVTGDAPEIPLQSREDMTAYITDCGSPSFNLPARMTCKSCTMCCNSLDQCLLNEDSDALILSIVIVPFGLCILLWFVSKCKNSKYLGSLAESNRLPKRIVDDDSVYLFVFSNDYRAIATFFFTVGIQICLFAIYLHASESTSENSDVVTPFRCPKNKSECDDLRSADMIGWILVCVVIFFYLGTDLLLSILQIHKAFAVRDHRMFMSGFTIFFLTALAFFTSLSYNKALARKNTDLIMNAVILLFINDLDEQCLEFITIVAPKWTQLVLEDVEKVLLGTDDTEDSFDATPESGKPDP